MKSNRLNLAIMFASLALGLCALCGLGSLVVYHQPLGPALGPPARETSLPSGAQHSFQLPQSATPSVTPQPLCGGPALMNLLLIGSDTRADSYLYGLSDAIRLVRVDFTLPRVTVLEMPRDLWVEIPDISSHYGITHGKLNQAYLYGNPGFGYYDGPGQGPGLLARTLDLNFGARPDHYAAVNLHTFAAVVDALGGLDVYLPYDVDARTPAFPDAIFIPKGQHHLDGETALWVARIRQYSVFSRAENQDLILCALRKKLTSPAVLPKIPALIQEFQRDVQTDLSLEQVNQLACLATQMSGRDVIFASFPINLFKGKTIYDPDLRANVFIWDTDFDVLRDYIGRFEAGAWPDPQAASQDIPSPTRPDSAFTCD
jgi:LCP family protein required for cell wall assembly